MGTTNENSKEFTKSLELFNNGIIIGKQWKAVDKCPCNHKKFNNQIRFFDKPFNINSENLMYPRDNQNGASESNLKGCMCWYKTLFAEVDEHLMKEI